MPDIRIASKKNTSNKIDQTCIIQLEPNSPGNGWFIYLDQGWKTPYRIIANFKTKLLAFKHIRDNLLSPGMTIQIEDRTYHYTYSEQSKSLRLTHTSEYFYMIKDYDLSI